MIPLSASTSESKLNSRPLVLVVEDASRVRMTMVDVLEDAGFQVIEAAHADQALRLLRAVSTIDAVITDVEMPRGSINGLEMAQRVRTVCQDIGILIASGRATLKQGELPDGALFIRKPVHPDTLVQLVRSLLGPIQH